MKTILITGCSSGFGLETAKFFLERGWKVIATMRTPKADLFPKADNLKILPLDVTNAESIKNVIQAAGPIDVLVNNAGIGLLNALEGTTIETVRDVFETNTIGTIAMCQAVIPQMRERKSGMIVNVTSTVTLKSLPLLAVYTGSKAAVNAFTESLAFELEPFNVRVKLVLPGRSPETKFAENAFEKKPEFPAQYQVLIQNVFKGWQESTDPVTYAHDVAEGVWNAVTEKNAPMKTYAGEDAKMWAKG